MNQKKVFFVQYKHEILERVIAICHLNKLVWLFITCITAQWSELAIWKTKLDNEDEKFFSLSLSRIG